MISGNVYFFHPPIDLAKHPLKTPEAETMASCSWHCWCLMCFFGWETSNTNLLWSWNWVILMPFFWEKTPPLFDQTKTMGLLEVGRFFYPGRWWGVIPNDRLEKYRTVLGGGFKYFLISPPLGEDSHFWLIFFKGVETTNYSCNSIHSNAFSKNNVAFPSLHVSVILHHPWEIPSMI